MSDTDSNTNFAPKRPKELGKVIEELDTIVQKLEGSLQNPDISGSYDRLNKVEGQLKEHQQWRIGYVDEISKIKQSIEDLMRSEKLGYGPNDITQEKLLKDIKQERLNLDLSFHKIMEIISENNDRLKMLDYVYDQSKPTTIIGIKQEKLDELNKIELAIPHNSTEIDEIKTTIDNMVKNKETILKEKKEVESRTEIRCDNMLLGHKTMMLTRLKVLEEEITLEEQGNTNFSDLIISHLSKVRDTFGKYEGKSNKQIEGCYEKSLITWDKEKKRISQSNGQIEKLKGLVVRYSNIEEDIKRMTESLTTQIEDESDHLNMNKKNFSEIHTQLVNRLENKDKWIKSFGDEFVQKLEEVDKTFDTKSKDFITETKNFFKKLDKYVEDQRKSIDSNKDSYTDIYRRNRIVDSKLDQMQREKCDQQYIDVTNTKIANFFTREIYPKIVYWDETLTSILVALGVFSIEHTKTVQERINEYEKAKISFLEALQKYRIQDLLPDQERIQNSWREFMRSFGLEAKLSQLEDERINDAESIDDLIKSSRKISIGIQQLLLSEHIHQKHASLDLMTKQVNDIFKAVSEYSDETKQVLFTSIANNLLFDATALNITNKKESQETLLDIFVDKITNPRSPDEVRSDIIILNKYLSRRINNLHKKFDKIVSHMKLNE